MLFVVVESSIEVDVVRFARRIAPSAHRGAREMHGLPACRPLFSLNLFPTVRRRSCRWCLACLAEDTGCSTAWSTRGRGVRRRHGSASPRSTNRRAAAGRHSFSSLRVSAHSILCSLLQPVVTQTFFFPEGPLPYPSCGVFASDFFRVEQTSVPCNMATSHENNDSDDECGSCTYLSDMMPWFIHPSSLCSSTQWSGEGPSFLCYHDWR